MSARRKTRLAENIEPAAGRDNARAAALASEAHGQRGKSKVRQRTPPTLRIGPTAASKRLRRPVSKAVLVTKSR